MKLSLIMLLYVIEYIKRWFNTLCKISLNKVDDNNLVVKYKETKTDEKKLDFWHFQVKIWSERMALEEKDVIFEYFIILRRTSVSYLNLP